MAYLPFVTQALGTASHGVAFQSESRADSEGYPFVDKLIELGLFDDALKTLKDSLRAHPHKVLPERYQVLSGGNLGFWRAVHRWIALNGTTVLEILLPLFILAGLVIRRLPEGWLRPSVIVTEFAGAGPDSGKRFVALFADEVFHHTTSANVGNLKLVTRPIEGMPPPATLDTVISQVLPWAKPFAWILNFLTFREVYTLSGTLHSSDLEGNGVTIALSRKNRVVTSTTLWERDFTGCTRSELQQNVARPYPLAEAAALWFIFEFPTSKGKTELWELGTDSWKSYALFRAAVHCEKTLLPAQAKRLYRRALDSDPKNLGARLNFASMVDHTNKNELARSIKVLQQVVEATRNRPKNPILYSSLYRRAIGLYELTRYAEAREMAFELKETIERALREVLPRRSRTYESKFHKYLESIRPTALILLYGLQIELNDKVDEKLFREIDATLPSYRTQYNLACLFSILAKKHPEERQAGYLERAMDHLEFAFMLNPALAGEARADCSLEYLKESAATKKMFQRLVIEVVNSGRR
jgi:tetratricopeptide (TPR) repeat protein